MAETKTGLEDGPLLHLGAGLVAGILGISVIAPASGTDISCRTTSTVDNFMKFQDVGPGCPIDPCFCLTF